MKKKILIVLILLSVCFSFKVEASCTDREIVNMSKQVDNVIFTPVFNENTEKYDLLITNLNSNLYFYDLVSQSYYKNTSSEVTLTNLGPNTTHRFKFYSANLSCKDEPLSSKYVTIPGYNPYYKRSECVPYENYKVCQKFTNYNYSESEFVKEINKLGLKNEKEEGKQEEETYKGFYDILAEFYVENYMFILPIGIIITLIIIVMQMKKLKKQDLF
jgi:hypothetical protein